MTAPSTPTVRDRVRAGTRWLLGVGLALAGTAHLTALRIEFRAQVPRWFPVDPDVVVLASGVVEIALGIALVVAGRHRRAVRVIGAVTALFFVAVFPGNLWQYLDGVDGFGLDTDAARFTRLWFQPLLVLWAWWSTRVGTPAPDPTCHPGATSAPSGPSDPATWEPP